jgi:hypothetical protein
MPQPLFQIRLMEPADAAQLAAYYYAQSGVSPRVVADRAGGILYAGISGRQVFGIPGAQRGGNRV